jgi:DNA-binding Lrp family transcriptional regulator
MTLDDIDTAILDILREDARISINALADRANISRSNAYARLHRLTEAGVVRGFTVRTDAIREGYHTSAYVALSIDQSEWKTIRQRLTALPEVRHIALVGGEFDVLALVRARDNQDLRRVVLQEMQDIPGVRSSRTFLVYEDLDTPTPSPRLASDGASGSP